MDTDTIAPMAIFFFCIALLTFWFKKRWKKKPEAKVGSYPEKTGKWKKLDRSSEDWVGGKWTPEKLEPEPPERSSGPEPEPPERSSGPEPEPPEKEPEPKE